MIPGLESIDRQKLDQKTGSRPIQVADNIASRQTLHQQDMIQITSPCPQSLIADLNIKQWPVWSCEASTFPWTYDDKETCLILEGHVTVTPDGGEPVDFSAGDLVEFPKGMSCTWHVKQAVRKHYQFG